MTEGRFEKRLETQDSLHPVPWSTHDILTATEGTLAFGDPHAIHASISTDSRTIQNNCLFVPLVGPDHDGHRFIDTAIHGGARCILAQASIIREMDTTPWHRAGVSLILVESTLGALGRLARFRRDASPARLVAITGSNGKTTTRALTASVLSTRHTVHATHGNFNNEVGLPLTLFRLAPGHTWSVVELGMNAPGEMRRLGHICRADIAVITCIGEAHLEGLGTLAKVTEAKAELLETLAPGATLIFNGDDPQLKKLARDRGLAPIWYGFSPDAQVRAEAVRWDGERQHFTLCHGGASQATSIPLAGAFMVQNALAAAAVGIEAGLSLPEIARGLENATTETGRLTLHHTPGGLHLIDDTYNANPLSMAAALETLTRVSHGKRSMAVLGDMRELGPEAPRFHRELGIKAASCGIQTLYITGEFAEEVRTGAMEAGLSPASIHTGDKDTLIRHITRHIHKGEWVLIKGSRSMSMEQVVTDLLCR